MSDNELKLLVIEDDETQAKAIEKALTNEGYSVVLANCYSQAQSALNLNAFHGLIVDCMLPDKNGVDAVVDFKNSSNENPLVILMSGIYKDKSFSREAMNKTGSKYFLEKPFNMPELTNIISQELGSATSSNTPSLYSLIEHADLSINDKIQIIQNTTSAHGFDLPLIYSFLSSPGINGDLIIQYNEENHSTVGFQNGCIDKVIHHDAESYFGVLLVENGFTSHEEVEEMLKSKNKKPIGERLVDASSLSPHAIEIVQHEQMVIRLSKTISETGIELLFEPAQRKSAITIDPPVLSNIMSDWIHTKLSLDWLRSFYNPRLEHKLERGTDFNAYEVLKANPIVAPVAKVFQNIERHSSIQDLISIASEKDTLKALHYLVLQKVFIIQKNKSRNSNWTGKRLRLEKLVTIMAQQNHFEVLGLNTKARDSQISSAYQELAKALHPDKLPPNSPDDIQKLTNNAFSRVTEAYQAINNEENRQKYLKTLELGLAEEVLHAESQFEKAYFSLVSKKYREARHAFLEVKKIKGHRSDISIYILWALVMEKRRKVDLQKLHSKCELLLSEVPHEDRHSPHYFFAKGLSYQIQGNLGKAAHFFKNAILLDNNFLEAKKELGITAKKMSRSKSSSFSADLSQVVTRFFKKKSG